MMERKIKVVIASPADTFNERKLLLDKLQTYFTRYQYEDLCHARLIVNGWEDVPSQSGYPQDTINEALIKKADILLALFRHKLGNPTINLKTGENRSPSGTAEELLFALNQNKKNRKPLAMLYYYDCPPSLNLFSVKAKKEWSKLQRFKEEIRTEIRHKLYNDDEEKLLRSVCDDICKNIKDHKLFAK